MEGILFPTRLSLGTHTVLKLRLLDNRTALRHERSVGEILGYGEVYAHSEIIHCLYALYRHIGQQNCSRYLVLGNTQPETRHLLLSNASHQPGGYKG